MFKTKKTPLAIFLLLIFSAFIGLGLNEYQMIERLVEIICTSCLGLG